MRSLFPAILGLSLAFTPARAQSDRGEADLEWVVKAPAPARMLADSLRRGRVRFLEVCGIACFTPGVGSVTYYKCYAAVAGISRADPTNEVIVSQRHDELKQRAFRFVERYNALLLDTLNRSGKRKCPPGERWDDYWHAVNSLAHALPAHPNHSFVTATAAAGPSERDFELHIQDTRDVSPKIYGGFCALAPTFGIRRVTFSVTSGNVNDHPTRHRGFTCLAGKVT